MINPYFKFGVFVSVISGVVLVSCSKQNTDSRRETFFLEDSLFQVTLDVPNELDSFYTWTDSDDTACGISRKYRFSNSSYQIFKETGFFWKSRPDSSYRLTISHVNQYYPYCFKYVDRENLAVRAEQLEANAKRDSVDCRIYSTDITKINKRDYAIATFKTDLNPKQKYQTTAIHAYAVLRDSVNVFVEYECAAKNCDGFIEKMEQSLKTIQIAKLKE